MASQEDTQEGDAKAQLLAEAFQKEGLDAAYWLPKVTQILGIKCREALQHLEYKDYLKLECEVQHPWEKKALQKLLKITEDKTASKDLQEHFLEKTKQRQEEATKALKDLTEMLNSHSHSQDALREKAETLWRAMEIPKEFWPPPKKPLADMLESIQKQLEQQELSAGRRENIPDTEVLRWASCGLALQGIYRTSRPEDVLAMREQLLRVPEGFQLSDPEQGSLLERKEFSSSAAESTFTKSMEQLGFSISVSAKSSFWGINLGGSIDHRSSSQSQDTHQSHSEQSYFCTTKYQYIPLASCYFQRHQLRLSDAALRELQDMEQQLLSCSQEEDNPTLVKMCESFFSRFGSHINQGPLHFGGIFWWKASTEGFQAERWEEMKRQTSEALNSFVRKSYGDFLVSAAGALDISRSSSQASVLRRARESSHTTIQLYVVNTGGPADTDYLPQWKTGLLSDNTTWCVIDRGFQLIPVWDIILCNHCGDFKSVHQMSRALSAGYKALTNESVDIVFGEELSSAVQEARDFMETVKAWEVTGNEEKLLILMKLKDHLNAKTRNPSVWINMCLSDKALQDFLVNTVRICQESPPENTTTIKVMLRSLLDPHIYSVKDFPESSSIMQWVFQTEHPLPRSPKVSEFQELIKTLQQMKEHIHAVTYTPGSSASDVHEAKIEATLTSSLAIYSLLQSLQEQAQKDMELLVLLIVTSTGYQVQSSTFQHLLGHPEIQYMAKEMEEAHAEYVNLKEQDTSRAEAFLLLTGLTLTPESQELSPEQKRECLVFMEDHMKGLWSTRIKNLLQKHTGDEDWERLERDLESLVSGCLDDKWDEQRMQNILRDLEDTFPTPEGPSQTQSKSDSSQSKANDAIANQEFLQLLERLGLESHYPRKMGMGDFCTICKTSLQDSQPSQDRELPFYFLQKLLTVDYQVRYLTCCNDCNQKLATLPQTTAKEHQHSENFEQFFDNLLEAAPEHACRDSHVHPMDLQMAIFHCADDFLRQTLATKLAFCQLALPLLVPNPSSSHFEFPLYALSQIQRSWKEVDKSGHRTRTKSYNNQLIFQAQTPIVSFIRIGSSASSSKSQLLNALLSKRKHDTFFHRHCRGSTRERLLMEGLVEIAWYCPGGSPDDSFERCVAFCNLHGDARDHEAQLQFLQEISAVNVALVSQLDHMDNRAKKLLQGLWQSQRPFVCLLTEKGNIAAQQASKIITIGIKNRNEAELVEELTKTIGNLLEGSNPCFSLEACLDKARQHGFIVDADQPTCVTAKAKAKELVELLKKEWLSEIRCQLLPLQENMWYQCCEMDKELTRLQEKGNKSIEHHRSQIENEKKEICRKQVELAFSLNPVMNPFLGFLQAQPADTKKYFLHWMKVFMDELSCCRLEELKRDSHDLWSVTRSEDKRKKNLRQSDFFRLSVDVSDETNYSSIGLEHILREVGQIYEALKLLNSKKDNFVKLPEIAAELMVSGYPVELMDGDASYLPLCWVGAIFDSLIERLGDKRVFVLSVLGIQSTGKSTLLNAMFGLQFNVSAGRCTHGAFMQLIPVGEEQQQDLGFDFVLVVDTKGLPAIQMANKQSQSQYDELATFVIGVSNMTLINFFGEIGEHPLRNPDFLEITLQAFLKIKEVNLSPSCLFVHQYVGEATAKEQNMEEQRRFLEKLDEMIVVDALQNFCDIFSFSNVASFDVKTHIHHFAHLWEGDPPMAPPNPTYSQNVQQLKSKILQAAKDSQRSILRLSSLKDRIGDLWNALLNENFVFSFKNSLEIAAYRKLETAFSQWTWRLRCHILDVQMRLDNKIRNGDWQNVTREHLEGLVQETSDAIEKEVEKYFQEDKDHETLVQWKLSTELKLKELKETLLHETKKKCENLIELQKEQRKLDERKLDYEDELLRMSRELAVSLKGKSLSERELEDNFTLVWNKWIAEVSCAARAPEWVDISAEIEDVLLEHFKHPGFHARITSFSRYRGFSFDPEKHIMKKKYLGFYSAPRSISNADVINFQHITDNIITRVKANIARKEEEKRDYSRNFIHEILNEVQEGVNSIPSNATCTFNREFSMDLSLYLCRMAAERFKAMHEAFQKANDPAVYLSSKREDFFQCFLISCQGATSVTTFAGFLCDKIEPALRRAVFERTAKDIAEDMQGKFPDFQGSRANLEVCILRYLAEQEKFEYFKQYLWSPKLFCQSYIETRVRSHCLDESRRLRTFLDSSLNNLYRNILSAVSSSTQIVKDRKDREDKVSLWLDEFCKELTEVINLPRSDLKGIEHQEVTDIEFLSSAMAEALDDLRERLMKELADADLSSFPMQPHTILAEHFSGCWEQCPFCGAVCTNTMQDHNGDHQLVFHRPRALRGGKWHGTDQLVIDICSSTLSSDGLFRVCDSQWFPYKRYQGAGPPYSTWNILPDSSMQTYWKWFVSRFRTQLEALYNGKFHGKGKIPEAWKRITKEEALSKLDKH